MEILVTGVNHRTAGLAVRERVAFSASGARQAMQELRAGALLREVTIVSTCNRSEIYGLAARTEDTVPRIVQFFSSFHGVEAAALDGSLYTHAGAEAARHLFRVSAGLDSMLLGEAEILGQVREAFRQAREAGATGPRLHRLFEDALAVGKRVRAETEIGLRPTSMALAAVRLVEKIFASLQGRTVLILGAGAMAEQTVECLVDRAVGRVLVSNRSPERGFELARRFRGYAVPWEDVENALGEADIVISSTSAPDFVLGPAPVERAIAARKNRPLFFIDIAVPRNIDPRVEKIYNVYLYNLEHFQQIVEQNKKEREKEIPRAERLVEEQVEKFLDWQEARALNAAGAALRRKLAATPEEEFHRQMSEHMLALPAPERERVAALVGSLVRQAAGARAPRPDDLRPLLAHLGSLEAVRAFFSLDEELP